MSDVASWDALSDPTRREIVRRLAATDLTAGEIAREFAIARPGVSRHLRVLREAGVVESERFKQWVYYRVAPGAITAVAKELAAAARGAKRAARNRRPCC